MHVIHWLLTGLLAGFTIYRCEGTDELHNQIES